MTIDKYKFSNKSIETLSTCHADLIILFNHVIKSRDCTILEGHRGKEAQEKAYREGKTKLHYPNGKHNSVPSMAVDVTPYPLRLKDIPYHVYFGGFVMGIADTLYRQNLMIHHVRWGGDWNGDLNTEDGWDFVHFELIK